MRRSREETSDAELLRAARRDPEAFGSLYRRHERLVLSWLVARSGRADLAADLAAETFAAAYLAAGRYRPDDGPVAAWLLGIARNKLRESLRRGRIEARARERMGLERIAFDDAALARVEALDGTLLALLDELPPEQREAVRAHVLDDEDYAALSERLAVSPAVVRKRVSRGLGALRRRLLQEAAGS